MILFDQITRNVKKKLFNSLLSRNLVYNTCWEDPRIDRELLRINRKSKIIMLTSAGCNALDYLIDNPGKIFCIDQNPRQNALMELKQSLFLNGDFNLLDRFFGKGHIPDAGEKYEHYLRKFLGREARNFWDEKITCFSNQNPDYTFYYYGTSGKIAWLAKKYFQRKNLMADIHKLLNAQTLKEQQYYFRELEEQLWTAFIQWFINRDAALSLLGVPTSQRRLIDHDFEGGIKEFIRTSLTRVFTRLSIKDNYFWRVYLTGRYTQTCRPNYLKYRYFSTIQRGITKISTHTTSLIDFLRHSPGKYSHFILLDHQDWMVEQNSDLLREEWKLILRNSSEGTRILFRTAGRSNDFLPDFVSHNVHFLPEITSHLHERDRVGTYGSTHLAVVQ